MKNKTLPHKFFGSLIFGRRQMLGIPQRRLAQHLGFAAQFMGRIEKGEVALPPAYLKKALKFLKIDGELALDALIADYKEKTKRDLRGE